MSKKQVIECTFGCKGGCGKPEHWRPVGDAQLDEHKTIEEWQYENPLLNERGRTHGEYEHTAMISQEIKRTMRRMSGFEAMPETVRESLDMIAVKIARIVSGDYTHRDSWDDIIGYAELARAAVCDD